MEPTRLYLLRHAETTWNAENRVQGSLDAPLSEVGLRQADAAARALATMPLAAMYASPLPRALATAERIALPTPSPSLRRRDYASSHKEYCLVPR